MAAKEISLRIEALLCEVNSAMYGKSDDILLNPYEEIVSAIEHRISQEKLEKFRLYYQVASGQSLQELIDENYDLELLLNDLRDLIKYNYL